MFNYKRFIALVIKELQDLPKNKNVILMFAMPLGYAVLYNNLFVGNSDMESSTWYVLTMCVGMSLLTGCSFASAMIIAEEKEKKTLRTMLLAGLKPMEFFFGKSVVCLSLTTLVNTLIFFYMGISISYFPVYLVLLLVVSVIMTVLGAVLGMISPNQMSTGLIGLPIMIIFLLIPMFAELDETLGSIARFVPTFGMNEMFRTLLAGENALSMTHHGFHMTVILSWFFIGLAIFTIIYKKIGLAK